MLAFDEFSSYKGKEEEMTWLLDGYPTNQMEVCCTNLPQLFR
jgi:hypothetical protein